MQFHYRIYSVQLKHLQLAILICWKLLIIGFILWKTAEKDLQQKEIRAHEANCKVLLTS